MMLWLYVSALHRLVRAVRVNGWSIIVIAKWSCPFT